MTKPASAQPKDRRNMGKKKNASGLSLLTEFGKFAPNAVFASLVLSVISGALYSLAIPLIISSLKRPGEGLSFVESNVQHVWFFDVSNIELATFFLLFCVFTLITRSLCGIMLTRVSLGLTSAMRVRLCDRVTRAPYATIEALGPAKLTVVVTDDVRRIISGAEVLPQLLVNGATLVGIFGFLFYLNQDALFFVLQAIIFGVITFQIPVYFARLDFRRARHLYDALEQGIRGLILGVKELQLDREKRTNYFRDVLIRNEHNLVKTEKRAVTTMLIANSYGDLLFFFVIGVISFVFVNYHSISTEELLGVVMVLLYVSGPVAAILTAVPRLTMATVSLRRIEAIFGELPDGMGEDRPLTKRQWQTVTFKDVCYAHQGDEHRDGFSVGPVSFAVRKGEVTFIVGGNGSGKSTLGKLLSLHYPPSAGSIRFDDHPVDDASVEDYRQCVTAIFSDYYLFNRLLCSFNEEKLAIADRYLSEFELDGKVSIKDGVFSTTDLSDGQRKRLALVVSFIDDKELILLDEWAADQDPIFKRIFYTKVLPDLKARGKAVVVVSHDDRYFHVADQILVMEDGKLVDRRSGDAVHEAPAVKVSAVG